MTREALAPISSGHYTPTRMMAFLFSSNFPEATDDGGHLPVWHLPPIVPDIDCRTHRNLRAFTAPSHGDLLLPNGRRAWGALV